MKETTQEILQKDAKDYLPVYGGRYGIALDHGKGVKVYDNDGKEYVDSSAASPSTCSATAIPHWWRL